MAELKYLGNLLGMPNVTDPMFPLAYTAFFGMDANRPLGLDPLSNVSIICQSLIVIMLGRVCIHVCLLL